ncbi:TonB-dependent siderophore receptor [Duganella sp. HH105]|uniref:TonB-dependent receptor plug domain-containing protein n=1 Tax=Duganella sp. HH105 TaxID=1781067 RepID=UPI000893DAB1|nr:TonB-dependent receptor [Duganella sp. HH105]OEZ62532.1 colicin I receptor precursor [Duganella sp. HH105]
MKPILLLCLAASANATAQDAAGMQRVEIAGSAAQTLRRNDTAAKIVVGRADIELYGDTTLSALLKRQPGISVAGGEVRMRGLGAGYTQLLINGEPAPQGMSIDAISPELIERIEILRTASAEYSAQALAGSINVILRKGSRAQRDIKLGIENLQGVNGSSAAMQIADRAGTLSYGLAGTLSDTGFHNTPATTERVEGPAALRTFTELNASQQTKLNLAPRLNWTLENGDTLAWQNLLDLYRTRSNGDSRETSIHGASTAYPDSDWRAQSHTVFLRSGLTWTHAVGAGGKLSVKLGYDYNHRNTDYAFHGASADGTPLFTRAVKSNADDDSITTSGKYLTRLREAHSLAIGWDGADTRRSEMRRQDDSAASGAALGRLLQEYEARVRRIALFAQDEWDVTPRLQAYLGLRWEGLDTRTDGAMLAAVQNRSSVFSPVAQMMWKLPNQERDQIRLALARTYKAPPTRDLLPRRYTINNDNGPTNPDVQGNPDLRPELAWGLDAAYESYFGKEGSASISAYARRIRDVTVQRLFEQNGSWVTTPYNGGKAKVAGIEFDAKFPLSAWPADVRLNASRNWSRLDAVPGPDNRLGTQIPFSANVGLDYRPAGALTLGFNAGLQTGGTVRISDKLASHTGVTRTLDAYALWKFDSKSRLRISLLNALHQDQLLGQFYADTSTSTARTSNTPTRAGIRAVYERQL